ncbi:MAG: hypothetical protein AAFO69_00705 [Bacteroidota bacterium]
MSILIYSIAKNNIKKSFLRLSTILAILLLSSSLIAQNQTGDDLPTVNIMSPNAAGLGKYVDYPVNMHTGVPQISIPIYTVSEGTLSLPISMSYHASGLKVNENASWVGAGWSLNAGGAISRTVRGTPDEVEGSSNRLAPRQGAGSLLRQSGFDDYYFRTVGNRTFADLEGFGKGLKDGEPDLFFFNFAGMSGQFYLDGRLEHQVVQIPQGDLKIELITQQGTVSDFGRDYIQGFQITNVDGTRYFFGRTSDPNDVDPVETSDVAVNGDGIAYDGIISSWFLHKIESADRRFSIDLQYEQERYSYYSYSPNYCAGASVCTPYFNAMKTVIQGVRLDNIEFTNGDVNFVESSALRQDLVGFNNNWAPTANSEARALASIQITNNGGGFCKAFDFEYDYFTSPSSPIPNNSSFDVNFRSIEDEIKDDKRLKLLSIQEKACVGSESIPKYSFQYYHETNVPRRFSFGVDHWGFANGVSQNELSPHRQANRASSEEAMKAGTLWKIKYPTGGETVFTYEANEVDIYVDQTCDSPDVVNIGSSISAGFTGTSPELSSPFTFDVEETSPKYLLCATVSSGTSSGYIKLNGVIVKNLSQGESFGEIFKLNPGLNTVQVYSGTSSSTGNGVLLQVKKPSTNSYPVAVGGLRVQKVEQQGADATTIVNSYTYEDPRLYSVPVYAFKVKNEGLRTSINELYAYNSQVDRQNDGCMLQNALSSYERSVIKVVENVHPMISVQGYHMGYGRVKRTQADGGYEVHYFEGEDGLPSHWNYLEDVKVMMVDDMTCEEDYPEFPVTPHPYEYERGRLKRMEIYDATDKLLREVEYSEEWEASDDPLVAVKVGAVNVHGPTSLAAFYEMRSYRKQWSKQIAKTFNPEDETQFQETKTTQYYSSDFHNMVTSVETLTDGVLVEQNTKYPEDIISCNVQRFCADCEQNYQTALTAAFDQWQLDRTSCFDDARDCSGFRGNELDVNDPDVCKDHCTLFAYREYLVKIRTARVNYNMCKETNCQQPTACNPGQATGVRKQMIDLIAKNQIALPVEIQLKRDNQLVGAVLNEYHEDSQGNFYLDKVFSLSNNQPLDNFQEYTVTSSNATRDPHYDSQPVGDLVYSQGNLVQRTGRDGVPTSYIWGYNNTVPIVMAVGVTYQTLLTAYNADPGGFREDVTLSKAFITTYEYDPLVGMTSMVDTNGIKVTYHYDKLGRLQYVKDQDGNYLSQNEYNFKN